MKVLGWLVLVVALAAGGLLAFLALRKPAMRPPSTEKIEATPERLARGRYLVENVTHCLGCHSDVPIRPVRHSDQARHAKGRAASRSTRVSACRASSRPRTSPSDPANGLGDWTDGEVLRAIREGVKRDGEALFPMMPYQKLPRA